MLTENLAFINLLFMMGLIGTMIPSIPGKGLEVPNEIDLSDHNDATQTGYYQRKGLNDQITLGADNWNNGTSGQNYYYFRYAEVLLNYAEAQNEAVGPDGRSTMQSTR